MVYWFYLISRVKQYSFLLMLLEKNMKKVIRETKDLCIECKAPAIVRK